MKRIAGLLLLCSLVLAAADRTVKVMTRNMDAGTDLNFVFAATDEASLQQALAATLAEVLAAKIPERAARLADEVALTQPDVIGLQEVTLWRTGPLSVEPTGASQVLYDQLELLKTALAQRKLHYRVVVLQQNVDIEVPVAAANLNLRLTDHDAILVRDGVAVVGTQTHVYQALLTLPLFGGVTIPRSFQSADVNLRGRKVRVFNTHLETTDPRVPDTVLLQQAQTQELLAAVNGSAMPAILLGDFNANAEPGPEHTGSVELILGAGLTDVWSALHPGDPGFTWPLFGEDFLLGVPVVPDERIDLIFALGLEPRSSQRVGLAAPFASDHAGVVASLEVED